MQTQTPIEAENVALKVLVKEKNNQLQQRDEQIKKLEALNKHRNWYMQQLKLNRKKLLVHLFLTTVPISDKLTIVLFSFT